MLRFQTRATEHVRLTVDSYLVMDGSRSGGAADWLVWRYALCRKHAPRLQLQGCIARLVDGVEVLLRT
jgi:hypothetical protein